MKYFLIVLTSLFMHFQGYTQPAEDSVKTVISNLFTGMKTADAKLVRDAFADSALMQTISRTRDGKTIVMNETPDDFASFVGTLKKDSADERIIFEVIKIDGSLAMVWTPYSFYHNGKFSHCGVNSFQLVRFNGTWKIQYLIDTRRKQLCN